MTLAAKLTDKQKWQHLLSSLRTKLSLGDLLLSCRAVFPFQLSPFGQAGCFPCYLTG